MIWRELKSVIEWMGLLALVVLVWVPWESLFSWVKEGVKRPNKRDVV